MREPIRGHQRQLEAIRAHLELTVQRHTKLWMALRERGVLDGRPEVHRELGHLMREAIRGHQRQSEAIRGHQRPSEAIRGHGELGHPEIGAQAAEE